MLLYGLSDRREQILTLIELMKQKITAKPGVQKHHQNLNQISNETPQNTYQSSNTCFGAFHWKSGVSSDDVFGHQVVY